MLAQHIRPNYKHVSNYSSLHLSSGMPVCCISMVMPINHCFRAYLFQGLVRLATVQYEPPSSSNASKRRMFLTNYAVNKSANRAMDVKAAERGAASTVVAPTCAAGAPASEAGEDVDDGSGSDKSNADSSDDEEDGGGSAGGLAPTASPGGRSTATVGSGARPQTSASSKGGKRLPQSKRYEPPMPPWATQVNACQARDGCKWTLDQMLQCMAEQVSTSGWTLSCHHIPRGADRESTQRSFGER